MKGSTLIETIIYIALLALIMGGSLMTVWGIVEGMGRVGERTARYEEGDFVLGKLRYAFAGAKSFSVGGAGCAQTLDVTRHDGTTFSFRLEDGAVVLNSGAGYLPLTAAASSTCLQFEAVSAGALSGVAATTTINGAVFTFSTYLRK